MTHKRKSGRSKTNKPVNYAKLAGMSSSQPSPSRSSSADSHNCPQRNISCESCGQLQATLNKLIDKVSQLEKQLAEQSVQIATQNAQLATQNQQIAAQLNDVQPAVSHIDQAKLEERLNEIEERIEERTNRQLRQTLVFRGLPERASEKSWADTEKVLATAIGTALNCDASEMINRCHRTGDPKYFTEAGRTRPIAAAMFAWKDCETIIDAFRNDRGSNIYADYKYGPKTTRRRNLAMKLRKELKQKGELKQAYVNYPAKLMGKREGDLRYRLIKDFSKEAV